MSEWNPMAQTFEQPPVTLADFLLARIAEDETEARLRWSESLHEIEFIAHGATSSDVFVHKWDESKDEVFAPHGTSITSSANRLHLEMTGRPDLARVLAECEAKRSIIERVREAEKAAREIGRHMDGDDVRSRVERAGYSQAASSIGQVLFDLALPYADHPDCREEWRA